MENAEEILQCLDEFSKMKPKDIPRELEEYLCFVAKTGDPVYQWSLIKSLFREKLINVITEFYESCPSVEIPPCPNVETFNYDVMKNFILEKLESFVAAPFTVQRICELLTTPRKEYNRIDKYMRALEKNILVVSTREPGQRRSTENGDSILNGLETDATTNSMGNEVHIEVDMEETPIWSPKSDIHDSGSYDVAKSYFKAETQQINSEELKSVADMPFATHDLDVNRTISNESTSIVESVIACNSNTETAEIASTSSTDESTTPSNEIFVDSSQQSPKDITEHPYITNINIIPGELFEEKTDSNIQTTNEDVSEVSQEKLIAPSEEENSFEKPDEAKAIEEQPQIEQDTLVHNTVLEGQEQTEPSETEPEKVDKPITNEFVNQQITSESNNQPSEPISTDLILSDNMIIPDPIVETNYVPEESKPMVEETEKTTDQVDDPVVSPTPENPTLEPCPVETSKDDNIESESNEIVNQSRASPVSEMTIAALSEMEGVDENVIPSNSPPKVEEPEENTIALNNLEDVEQKQSKPEISVECSQPIVEPEMMPIVEKPTDEISQVEPSTEELSIPAPEPESMEKEMDDNTMDNNISEVAQ